MDPAQEGHAQEKVKHGRDPSPVNGNDDPDNWAQPADGFKLEAEEDVPTSRHEIDSIHIHRGWCGFIRVGSNDFSIHVPAISIVNKDGPSYGYKQSNK